ncbi:chemotaxis protein CheW [Candidatus Raskinella chloraquaticus]|uniref:Chemotaxis protein CheW n=1 Tax=Candidatus Raskinella chloraquaticus TaxID=1951219 RepID=A0A1W9HVH1_9HYPH|nr:chemotaxis protein CheW [Hyphomicrobiales bacterium]OQW51287.1 MAG: chemotaxis protein CheW [Proteobacteria bacterium SG_bin8]OQW85060.1 MAG: chemotaxis protein CheW [Proteobacteria bacterium ST_bin15]
MSDDMIHHGDSHQEYVTVMIGPQLFGLPISRVQDVFMPDTITRVPLASQEIAGVLNLRGRIVTAVDMRRRLSLPQVEGKAHRHAVGVEQAGEAYGLIIDSVGEVLNLAVDRLEPNPVNLDRRWASVSAGVYRLDGQLLVILDIDRVLAFGEEAAAA